MGGEDGLSYSAESKYRTVYNAITNTATAGICGMVYSDKNFELGLDALEYVVNQPDEIVQYGALAFGAVAGLRAIQNVSKLTGMRYDDPENIYPDVIDASTAITTSYGSLALLGKTAYDSFDKISDFLEGAYTAVHEFASALPYKLAYTTEEQAPKMLAKEISKTYHETGIPDLIDSTGDYIASHPVETGILTGIIGSSIYLNKKIAKIRDE